jgi:hypothetical protein
MSSNDEILNKIERFTKGQMSPEEASSFEKEISLDKELQHQVELSEMAENLVVFHETAKLKAIMQKDFATQQLRKQMIWGASIVAILATSLLVWNSQKETEIKQKEKEITSIVQGKPVKQAETSGGKDKVSKPEIEKKTLESGKLKNTNSKVELNNSKKQSDFKTITPSDFRLEEKQTLDNKEEKLVDATKPKESTSTNENIKETKSVSMIPDVCDYKLEGVKFTVSPSCKGESNGKILVLKEGIKGGKAPYTLMIDGRQSKNTFENLQAKEYILIVKDANDCSKQYQEKIRVTEISCETKQYVFNPEYDKMWQFPFNEDKSPRSIIIKNESGITFYSTDISGLSPSEWNGDSNRGMISKPGVYFYSILYTDDSVDDGTIMISK